MDLVTALNRAEASLDFFEPLKDIRDVLAAAKEADTTLRQLDKLKAAKESDITRLASVLDKAKQGHEESLRQLTLLKADVDRQRAKINQEFSAELERQSAKHKQEVGQLEQATNLARSEYHSTITNLKAEVEALTRKLAASKTEYEAFLAKVRI